MLKNYWSPPLGPDRDDFSNSNVSVPANRVKIINVGSFPIVFSRDNCGGDTFIVAPQRSQTLVMGRRMEKEAEGDAPVKVGQPRKIYSGWVATHDGLATLDQLEVENPGAIIVGTLRAAEAYPGRILVPVPIDGHEKLPPSERIMRTDVFVRRVPQVSQ